MRRWLAVTAILAGCSAERTDPSASRLDPGETALIVSRTEDSVTMVPEGWTLERQTEDGVQLCHLAAGTRVTCEDDPVDGGPSRRVKVLALDGHYKGRIGFVNREELRPVAK